MALYRGRLWDRVGCSAGGSAQCQWLAGSRRPHCQTLPACRPAGSWARPAIACRSAAREHANSTFPWARLKKNSPAHACGGLFWPKFWGHSRGFLVFSPPVNPSFGDHIIGEPVAIIARAKNLGYIFCFKHSTNRIRRSTRDRALSLAAKALIAAARA